MTAQAATAPATTALPLKDQTVLVTGGARGLGAAISTAFLEAGANVVINYKTSNEAANVLAQKYPQQALAVQADVRDASAL